MNDDLWVSQLTETEQVGNDVAIQTTLRHVEAVDVFEVAVFVCVPVGRPPTLPTLLALHTPIHEHICGDVEIGGAVTAELDVTRELKRYADALAVSCSK